MYRQDRNNASTSHIPGAYHATAYLIANVLDAWQAARGRRAGDLAMKATIQRLGETSPHLLEDIGMDGIDRR
jgi:hypothetical protein